MFQVLSFKWRHFQKDSILLVVRWYLSYSLSYRDIEEMMLDRGISVDHFTINRCVIHYSPQHHRGIKRIVSSRKQAKILI